MRLRSNSRDCFNVPLPHTIHPPWGDQATSHTRSMCPSSWCSILKEGHFSAFLTSITILRNKLYNKIFIRSKAKKKARVGLSSCVTDVTLNDVRGGFWTSGKMDGEQQSIDEQALPAGAPDSVPGAQQEPGPHLSYDADSGRFFCPFPGKFWQRLTCPTNCCSRCQFYTGTHLLLAAHTSRHIHT